MPENATALTCPVCDEARPATRMLSGISLPQSITAILARRRPGWVPQAQVCRTCVNQAKAVHMRDMLVADMGELPPQAAEVLARIGNEEMVAVNINDEIAVPRGSLEQMADRLTAFIGSWTFAGTILLLLATWVSINVLFKPFEPYPAIVLAVIGAALASMAALEAPIIMMSQRRQATRDRLRADNDYRVNLKAELEIEYLEEKLDHLIGRRAADHET